MITHDPHRGGSVLVCVCGGGEGDHQYWEDRKSYPHRPGV